VSARLSRASHGTTSTRPRAPWRIVAAFDLALTSRESGPARALAERIRADEPALDPSWFRAEGVTSGWGPGPGVYFEDHREIQLTTEAHARAFEYRALGLAGSDDFYLLAGDRSEEFEKYLRDVVALGAPHILALRRKWTEAGRSMADRCMAEPAVLEALVRAAQDSGGLNLVPYLTTGRVWALARSLARAARQPICVAGPSPRLALRANDKLWFAARVRELLGSRSLPPTLSVFGLPVAAARLKKLAQTTERVVVKVTASAGGVGNLTFDSAEFRAISLGDVLARVRAGLEEMGWPGCFPILLGVWEGPVIASPSAQIWIPPMEDGAPLIEGAFVQTLSKSGGFVGASPADLDDSTRLRFLDEALRIATFFQALGYFGRLSLDAILLRKRPETADIHWIECNARWGGVSLPLTIANRFRPERPPGGIAIVQRPLDSDRPLPLRRVLEHLDDALLRPSPEGRAVIFLLPTESGTLDFVTLSHDPADARALAMEIAALPGSNGDDRADAAISPGGSSGSVGSA